MDGGGYFFERHIYECMFTTNFITTFGRERGNFSWIFLYILMLILLNLIPLIDFSVDGFSIYQVFDHEEKKYIIDTPLVYNCRFLMRQCSLCIEKKTIKKHCAVNIIAACN